MNSLRLTFRLYIICVCIAIAGYAAPAGLFAQETRTTASSPEALDLNACYRLALARSEEDRIRAEDLRIAEARYQETIGGYFPAFSLFAEQSWRDKIDRDENAALTREIIQEVNPEAAEFLPGRSVFVDDRPGANNPRLIGARMTWTLFRGFRTYRESRALELDLQALGRQRRRFRELLYRDLADVFYQTIQFQESLNILGDEERALRARIGELARFLRLGRARQGELLAARSDLSANLVQQEETRGLERASRELLAFLIGRRADAFALRDASDIPEAGELQRYLEQSQERADVLAAAAGLRAERERLKGARGERAPELSLDGQYNLEERPDNQRDWRVNLRLELPIFEGGAISARIRQTRAEVRASELNLERMRRNADYEVRMAYHEFVSAAARAVLLEEQVRLARAEYAVQLRDYRLGIVTNLEVLSALARLHQARRQQVATGLESRVAHIRLHVAAGRAPEALGRFETEEDDPYRLDDIDEADDLEEIKSEDADGTKETEG